MVLLTLILTHSHTHTHTYTHTTLKSLFKQEIQAQKVGFDRRRFVDYFFKRHTKSHPKDFPKRFIKICQPTLIYHISSSADIFERILLFAVTNKWIK